MNSGPDVEVGGAMALVAAVVQEFVTAGELDAESRVDVISGNEVAVLYLRATHPQTGVGRHFLRGLKEQGLQVHVRYPTLDALPFWRRMYAEGLIVDDPEQLCTWEQFLQSTESQMQLPSTEGVA